MLISFEKRFIFIHIPKTAGTSLTRLLQQYAHQPVPTQWRRLLSRLPVREDPEKAWFRTHDRAAWLKQKMPDEIFDGFYKFAVVRNPYDYAVSYFRFLQANQNSRRHKDAKSWEFADFLRYMEEKNQHNPIVQNSWITDDGGDIIVDEILRFESLEQDVDELCRRLDIPPGASLPHVNVGNRSDYQDYFGPAEREIADRLFKPDLEVLGYSF